MNKEKEVYLTPMLETVYFEVEDIITTSSGGGDGGVIELPTIPINEKSVW